MRDRVSSNNKAALSNYAQIIEINKYIDTCDKLTYRDVVEYAARNGYWDALRKSPQYTLRYINVHNARIFNRDKNKEV